MPQPESRAAASQQVVVELAASDSVAQRLAARRGLYGILAGRRRNPRNRAAAAKSAPNLMILLLTFVLIFSLGIAGIIGLRFLSGLG